jgi:predicted dehydrogenase
MKRLRVGVVGCGHNSENHLRVYSHTDGVQLVAVCDAILSRAEEKARRYGVEKALSDFNSLLKCDLDLVDIVTPTVTHGSLTQLALETGHNVLVEKPMAISSDECLRMIRTARKNGRTLCVVHNKRFFDSVIQARRAIDDGSLKMSRMRVTHYFAYGRFLERWRLNEESGGLLWDAVVHPIYLTEHLMGPVSSVYAVARKVKEHAFDSFTIVLQNERIGVIEFAWNATQPLLEFQLLGEGGESFHGNLVYDVVTRKSREDSNFGAYLLGVAAQDLHFPKARAMRYFRNFWEIRSYPGALPFAKTFFTLIRRYLSFLRTESGNPPVPAEEGLRTVMVLEAVKSSIGSGRPQHVPVA